MLEDIICLLRRKCHKILPFTLFSTLLFLSLTTSSFSQDTPDTSQVASTDDISQTDVQADAQAGAPSDTTAAAPAEEGALPTDPQIIDSGRTLFNNYCKVCHAVHEQVIGPALAGVYERKEIPWLIRFIRNSQQVIESGDPYAVELYEQYNKTQMPSHDLSDDEILAILAYVQDQTLNPPAETAAAAGQATGAGTASSGISISSGFLIAIMVALIIVLIVILVVLVMLMQTLTRYMKQKKGLDESELEVIGQRFNIMELIRKPSFVGIAAFIFAAVMMKLVIDGLYSVGIQQDYAPVQPIAYSHKVHAGDYQIQCEFCHTGAATSRSANIPSASVCMNCHSAIVKIQGADEPSEEIQKIYDAIENDRPIEWVRVHNLPDLAYFNHAQHYKVGNIQCQDCHGPIETMEVVRQHSTLTMGWCIDCHRETVIQTDNAYYDQLLELHEQVSSEDMLVSDIGGLECSKCHY